MFRNFDNHDFYIDNDRKILAGCLQFMLKDGTTSANIYDSDKVPIANPQITDINGRTEQQVFVEDDVIAYVYKYVGQGSIATERQHEIDTSDQSKWSLQYTVESSSIDERAIDGKSAMGVNTIDDLRQIDPYEVPEVFGVKIITLNGYYEAGDKEPINYVWDPQSMLNDDNGSVIQGNNLTGRWIMVQPTEHCDSRHFGVFPQDSSDSEVDHSTRMTQLISYCNTHSIHPYFNGSQSYPYFIYTSVAFNSRNAIDVSNDTVFVDKGLNNRFYGEWNGNPYFYHADTTVNATTVRHSWHFKNYAEGTTKYIVDSDWSPVLLSNIEVELETSPASDSQFNDCELVSNEKITNRIVLENMTIHTDWFADDYNWADLQMNNCNIILQNCKDANTYVLLKNKVGEANYGDLGEQTLSNTTLLANCIAENASFSNVTLTGNTELHNVSGSVTISGSAYTLNVVDCWLSFSNTSQIVLDNVMWRRGSVTASARIQTLTSLLLDNVDVNASFYTPGVNAQFISCNIRSEQYLFRLVNVSRCMVYANINQYPEANVRVEEFGTYYYWDGEYFGNTFIGNACIVWAPISGVDYTGLALGTTAKVCNNLSDHAFIDDSQWNGLTYSGWDGSLFRYQGNSGGCPVFEDEITYSIPYSLKWQFTEDPYDYSVNTNYYCANISGAVGNTGVWIVSDGRTAPERDVPYDVYWVINLYNVAIPVKNLFRLPYLRRYNTLIVDADVNVFIRPDGYSNWPFYTNEFHIPSTFLNTQVLGNESTAHLSTLRPLKYHYCGTRYCDHDGIDNWRSSLRACMYWADDEPSNFGFAGTIRYKFKFGDFGKTTPVG